MNAFTFAVVLPTLLVAHNLADHLIQTDHQAAHKARSWRAMSGHVTGYTITSVAFLAIIWFALDVQPDWQWTLAGLAFSAGTHALIDRRWPVLWLLRATRSPGFAASRVVEVHLDVDGEGRAHTSGVPTSVAARGLLPLHGPYLADQALHWACLFVAALLISGGPA
jgi:hypothetical protein